jgi:hypothetical protein
MFITLIFLFTSKFEKKKKLNYLKQVVFFMSASFFVVRFSVIFLFEVPSGRWNETTQNSFRIQQTKEDEKKYPLKNTEEYYFRDIHDCACCYTPIEGFDLPEYKM